MLVAALCRAARRRTRMRRRAVAARASRHDQRRAWSWSGGYAIGDATAQLRGNGLGATPPPFTLFTADSRVDAGRRRRELRVGFALTPDAGDRSAAAPLRGRASASRSRGDAEAPAQDCSRRGARSNTCSTAALTWQLPLRARAPAARRSCPAAPATCGSCTKSARWSRPGRSTTPAAACGTGCAAATARARSLGLRGDARVNWRQRRHRLRGQDAHLPDVLRSSVVRWPLTCRAEACGEGRHRRSSSPTSRPVAAAAACCTTCRCRSAPARSWRWSGAAAPARPRCCGWSIACSIPIAGACSSTGRDTREWDPIALRRRTGYVIQDVGLFPHLTVAGNIAIVPRLLGWAEARVQRARRRAADAGRLDAGDVSATAGPTNCPAASGSASAWRARWPRIRRCC